VGLRQAAAGADQESGSVEDSRISLRYFIVKVMIGRPLEGGGWAGARQAAAGADQESGQVPGGGGQSLFTQVLDH
jgi:hypothetical protein